jgi:hypothetical protein
VVGKVISVDGGEELGVVENLLGGTRGVEYIARGALGGDMERAVVLTGACLEGETIFRLGLA